MIGRRDKYKKNSDDSEEGEEEKDKVEIEADDIRKDLDLEAHQKGGAQKATAGSKVSLMNDLMDTMNKEVDKLKRLEDNL
jgi:hypothetical protein